MATQAGPAGPRDTLLIRGGRVYDPQGDVDDPPVRDIRIENGSIVSVTGPHDRDPAASAAGAEVIDASGKLVVPGFVNAHYHSYDTLAKGMFEDMPFDIWALQALPAPFGKRSRAELRTRTLLGAAECIRHGITTVQDMCTVVPLNEETLDVILAAYAEAGIRVVFSIGLRDIAELDIAPFLADDAPPAVRDIVRGTAGDARADLDFVERQIVRRPAGDNLHWGLSPSGPQRSSQTLLEGVADLARRHGLPVFTHVYETKAQAAKARMIYQAQGGSMIRHLADLGLLGPRSTLAHGVWLAPEEIEILAGTGTSIAHNPMSNMKLKSGVAPIRELHDAGVPVALGCDNCSCSDCQNIFQAMKLFCLLAAVTDLEPVGLHARHAIAAATHVGAQAVGLGGKVGRIEPGMSADLTLIDLDDIAYMPLNSVARQLVYSECGRAVDSVLIGGRIVMRNRQLTTIDEAALRDELNALMPAFRRDAERVRQAAVSVSPYLLEANRRVAAQDVGLRRLLQPAHVKSLI